MSSPDGSFKLKLLEFLAEKCLEVLELCPYLRGFVLATVRPMFLNLFDVGFGLAGSDAVTCCVDELF